MKKNKLGVISYISIALTILLCLGYGLLSILCLFESNTEAAGWGLGFVIIAAILTLPYFIVLTIISIICDLKINGSKIVKDIIIGILLFIPVCLLGLFMLLVLIDSAQKPKRIIDYEKNSYIEIGDYYG